MFLGIMVDQSGVGGRGCVYKYGLSGGVRENGDSRTSALRKAIIMIAAWPSFFLSLAESNDFVTMSC